MLMAWVWLPYPFTKLLTFIFAGRQTLPAPCEDDEEGGAREVAGDRSLVRSEFRLRRVEV